MVDASASSDFDLLDRWAEGAMDAGNALFERYFGEVYRFFEHKVNAEAADLVQRTFLACVEGRSRFRRASSFRTYVYAIARNVLLAHFREKKRHDIDSNLSTLQDFGPSPSTLLGQHHERRLLVEALSSIPIDLQIALELYYWEQLTAGELAEVLDIPEGTVRSRLRRAIESLKDKLGELETSPERLASTLASLEGWAAALRASPMET